MNNFASRKNICDNAYNTCFFYTKVPKTAGIAKAYFILWKKKYFLVHLHFCNSLNDKNISVSLFFFDQKTKKNDCRVKKKVYLCSCFLLKKSEAKRAVKP